MEKELLFHLTETRWKQAQLTFEKVVGRSMLLFHGRLSFIAGVPVAVGLKYQLLPLTYTHKKMPYSML